jgi:hypothetical protein
MLPKLFRAAASPKQLRLAASVREGVPRLRVWRFTLTHSHARPLPQR